MIKPASLLVPALALGAVLTAAPANAQDAPAPVAELIDARMAEFLEDIELPGATAALVVDGEAVLTEAYGEAVVDGAPFEADTAYYTGSIAKLFTTASALQLVHEGALDLDADVNDTLTGFAIPDTYPGEPITLRHLLTHSSGFEDGILGWSRWAPEDMPTLAEFAEEAVPERRREPGAVVTYNNYDMVLAGVLIEEASGQSYEDYVAEHVFAPLGMEDSEVVRAEPAKGAEVAEGYRYAEGQIPTAGRLSPGTPSGPGVLTSVEDMSRFMIAVIERDPALGEGVAEQMTTRQFGPDDRMPGMGFSFEEFAGANEGVWFKGGDVPGYHNAMVLVPEQGIGFYLGYNGDGPADGDVEDDASAILDDVLTELGALPDPPTLAPVEVGDLDRYTGEYVSTRTSNSDFTELIRVFDPVTVRAEQGELVTTGLSSEERHWVPVGEDLFQERDGTATIAFTADGLMLSSESPTRAYTPVPWYDSAPIHLAGLAFGALILVVGFLTLTIRAIVKLFRRGDRNPALRTATAVLAWLLAGTALGMLTLMMTLMTDMNLMNQHLSTASAELTTVAALSIGTVGLTLLTTLTFIITATKRQWTKATAASYTLMLLAALAFSAVLITLNLAAF
ncbi:serine hydrolase domain-containing protein [Glycomyces sp. NPDC046736]|uniref:serine hydrolase domain-containing protein n=1 Tax=Glycomyces sp. NPDC046736 TaxID=3155615 RepID=UPI0033DF11A3